MIKVKMFDGMGRGIVATTDLLLGDIVAQCELLVLSPDDTVKVNQTDLKYYTFKYSDTQDCLVLGLGEIFNHSDTPNVAYQIEEVDGRPMMRFIVMSEVKSGEQLFIDYGLDVDVNVNQYLNTKSLI